MLHACASSRSPGPRRPIHQAAASSDPWDWVPRHTDWMLVVAPQRLPEEVRARFGSLLARPCERAGDAVMAAWFFGEEPGMGPFSVELRRYGAAAAEREGAAWKGRICPADVEKGRHRGFPVIKAPGGRVRLELPDTRVEGPEPLARFVADRVLGKGSAFGGNPEEMRRAAIWRSRFEPEPVVALWFWRSARVARFLSIYPSPPLRGSLMFVRSRGWVIFRMQLAFADTATAEKAVEQTRDALISAVHSGLYPRMDWKAILSPLSVHPEGAALWMQWSLPESRALELWRLLW